MINVNVDFDNFIERFYSSISDNKIIFELNIDSNDSSTIYDVHIMLLELFIKGLNMFNLNIYTYLDNTIIHLQKYYSNINIGIQINTFTKNELLNDDNRYANRYMRINSDCSFIKNGSHNNKLITDLSQIESFFTFDNNFNLRISFSHIIS
jgi:hypothetical protein